MLFRERFRRWFTTAEVSVILVVFDTFWLISSWLLLPCVSSLLTSIVDFFNFRRQFSERFSWSTVVLNCVT